MGPLPTHSWTLPYSILIESQVLSKILDTLPIFNWQVSLAYVTTFLCILLLQYIFKLIPCSELSFRGPNLGPYHIHSGSTNRKISECLGVNMRTDSYSYWWKPNTQFTSWCLGRSRSLHLATWLPTQHEGPHHVWISLLPIWIEKVTARRYGEKSDMANIREVNKRFKYARHFLYRIFYQMTTC